MEVYYLIVFFIIGTVLGSFYNVVGYRLPKGESIVYPASHCPNCDHKLGPLELIPIFSYLFQKGKCKNCQQKISLFYPIFEFLGGILFALAYYIFGFTPDLLIALTFISLVLIVMVSDYHYLIISDGVLAVVGILLLLEVFFLKGPEEALTAVISGFIAFLVMFSIKKLGDFMFKKESMGGGDIKLMFIFGLVLDFPVALFAIFLGSLIGLPISLIIMFKKNTHIIPFGPFLCVAALILFFLQVDTDMIMQLLIRS